MEKIIAIGQMCATNDKLSNRQQVQEIVESAAKQKACVSLNPIQKSNSFSFPLIAFTLF